jgi:uncharacterized protein (DUF1501 family)
MVHTDAFANGLVLGNSPGPLGGLEQTVVMHNSRQFIRQANRMHATSTTSANPALAHLLKTQNAIHQSARKLQNRLQHAPVLKAEFPKSQLGRQLSTLAHILISGIYVPVIKISLGSFDTHSNQRNRHQRLLQDLAQSLATFENVMVKHKLWDNILIMTYSEFGRRAQENASRGTDHGTASSHFILGGSVRGGLYGKQPSLTRLLNDDLLHHVDYRSLYNTVIARWWGLATTPLDRRRYPLLDFLT